MNNIVFTPMPYRPNAKKVVYEGITYPSLEELARHQRCSPQLLRYYLKNDKPFGGSYIDYALTDHID